jgi:hypothetical protein
MNATSAVFSRVQLQFQYEAEKFQHIFPCQQIVIVEVWRRLLDTTQGEGPNPRLCGGNQAIDRPGLKQLIDLQVVHQVVGVKQGGGARGASSLAKEQLLAAHLGRVRRELAGSSFPSQRRDKQR